MNPDTIHLTLSFVVSSGMLLLIWKGIRVVNRLWDVLKDYPPHRHDNGHIVFPKGFEPPETQDLYRTGNR